MKLGINGWRIHGQRTGVGRYVLNVVRHWTADVASAFSRITCYVPKPLDRNEVPLPDKIDVKVLASDLPMLAWDNLRLAPSSQDDVLFCPSYSRPVFSRGKTVVTTHDAVPQIHPELFPRSVGLFYNRLYGWSARHAALAITDSEAARQDIARCWKVPLDRIRVVYLAPVESFRPCHDESKLEACHRRAVGSSAPFFLFVGKISGRRNIPCLVEAFALFKKLTTHPQCLLLVGLNPHQMDLGALCRSLGVAEHVRVCGYVTDEELNLLYNRAEALVMPSVYETVSLPVMEAQAVGAPVICIDTAGMREITGGAAAMIPKLEAQALLAAMIRVVEDKAFRSDIASRGLENSSRFSWLRCSKETLAVLTEAAATR
jgi:glycosyltransferase involved in cell wall biosynthesis